MNGNSMGNGMGNNAGNGMGGGHNCPVCPSMPEDGGQEELYRVQAGAFRDRQNADNLLSLLENDGWKAGSDGIREKNGKRLEFKMILPDGMYPKDVILSETIQNQLKAVGIGVTLNKVEKSTYWDQLKVPKASANYDMALWGYNPSHGNGQIHLESLFTSNPDESQKPGLWNFIWYQNGQVDELLAKAKTQVDADEFAETMKEAQEIVWEDCPYIWLYSNNIISAKRKDVGNVTVLPVVFTLVHRVQ